MKKERLEAIQKKETEFKRVPKENFWIWRVVFPEETRAD
jgi:hypothetical protein